MKRIRIGNHVLTLDLITDAVMDLDKNILTVYLAAPAMVKGLDDQAVRIFKGDEARVFWHYLVTTECQDFKSV